MTTRRLQQQLDQALAATAQRWLLGGVAALAATLASATMTMRSTHGDGWVVVVVAVLAVVAAIQPDEHTALIVVAIVVMHWLAVGGGVDSAWSMAIAGALFVFHTVIALMAVTPHTAVVHSAILRRWLVRSAVMIPATVGVWILVGVFERREAPGNAALSALAFAILAVAVVALRVRSIGPTSRPR